MKEEIEVEFVPNPEIKPSLAERFKLETDSKWTLEKIKKEIEKFRREYD